jgi:hypothetical protein
MYKSTGFMWLNNLPVSEMLKYRRCLYFVLRSEIHDVSKKIFYLKLMMQEIFPSCIIVAPVKSYQPITLSQLKRPIYYRAFHYFACFWRSLTGNRIRKIRIFISSIPWTMSWFPNWNPSCRLHDLNISSSHTNPLNSLATISLIS